MPRFTFHLPGNFEPVRADQYLASQPGMPSRSALRKYFDEGLIIVNARAVKASHKLAPGDEIAFDLPEPRDPGVSAEDLPVTVIYQDADVIVVDKPAGIMTHPTKNQRTGTLVNALLHLCTELSGVGGVLRPGIVHRLDKLTSGVMVAAKNDAAHQHLAAQFKAHSIDRRYLALVYGEPPRLSGRFESQIARNPVHRLRMTGKRGEGRRAVTNYRALGRAHGFSLLELRLETGRTHQIRVHLSEAGHPVAGDALYGKHRNPSDKLDPVIRSAIRQLKRQALHAFHLGFEHPAGLGWMAFASPPPEDIRAALHALGLEHGLPIPDEPLRMK